MNIFENHVICERCGDAFSSVQDESGGIYCPHCGKGWKSFNLHEECRRMDSAIQQRAAAAEGDRRALKRIKRIAQGQDPDATVSQVDDARAVLQQLGIPYEIDTARIERTEKRRRRKEDLLHKREHYPVDDTVKNQPLQDANWQVRRDAVVQLGESATAKTIPLLIETLKDEVEDVRMAAVVALEKTNDTDAVEPLIEALDDQYWGVRRDAAKALGNIGDSRAVRPLIEALRWEDSGSYAATALATINAPGTVELLMTSMRTGDWPLRCGCILAIGSFDDPQAIPVLVDALKDDYWQIRQASVIALGSIKDSRAVEPLIEALDDSVPDVRWCAASSLGNIKDKRALTPLKKALEDENATVREYSIEAIRALNCES